MSLVFTGAGERSRTPDLRITNALLYLLSYTGTSGALSNFAGVGSRPLPANRSAEAEAALRDVTSQPKSSLSY